MSPFYCLLSPRMYRRASISISFRCYANAYISLPFQSLLTCDELAGVPFLILGNKIDCGHPHRPINAPILIAHLQHLLAGLLVKSNPYLHHALPHSSSGNAASEDELRDTLGLFETTGKECKAVDQGMKPLEVYMCSVVKRMGYADGFRWLSNYL